MSGPSTSSEPSKTNGCTHKGTALWITPISWWCGNCGLSVGDSAFAARTRVEGDSLVRFDD